MVFLIWATIVVDFNWPEPQILYQSLIQALIHFLVLSDGAKKRGDYDMFGGLSSISIWLGHFIIYIYQKKKKKPKIKSLSKSWRG